MDNSQDEIIYQGRLTGAQRIRLKSLYDMLYRPRELAEELGIDQNQVYRAYIKLGCPHERDKHRHLWINGKDFREWYFAVYKKAKIAKDEAYCQTCKKGVKMIDPVKHEKEGLSYYTCQCPICKRNLSRIITQKRIWKK